MSSSLNCRLACLTDYAVESQNSLTGSEEVAVVIGIQSCATRACISPSEFMGNILYNGQFNPQYHEPYLPPYQNFTVQVPSSFSGTALIGVAHVTLIGVSGYDTDNKMTPTLTSVCAGRALSILGDVEPDDHRRVM
jgi:hypothetical protein